MVFFVVLSGTHIIPVCFHRYFDPIFLFSEVLVRYVAKCNRMHYQFFLITGHSKMDRFLGRSCKLVARCTKKFISFSCGSLFHFC